MILDRLRLGDPGAAWAHPMVMVGRVGEWGWLRRWQLLGCLVYVREGWPTGAGCVCGERGRGG